MNGETKIILTKYQKQLLLAYQGRDWHFAPDPIVKSLLAQRPPIAKFPRLIAAGKGLWQFLGWSV